MLDQLRHDIQARLDELLTEVQRLRHALAALGSRDSTPSPPASASSSPTRARPSATVVRTAPGATKTAVLAALASGDALTAGEIAKVTGLGRASVSTTLSKLVKTGELTKAPRGYQLAGKTDTAPAAGAADSTEDGQRVT
jgi:CRP-like cAMP-binding protein